MESAKEKVIVHLKSGTQLSYVADIGALDRWLKHFLNEENVAILFGRFTVPVKEIEYVEVR